MADEDALGVPSDADPIEVACPRRRRRPRRARLRDPARPAPARRSRDGCAPRRRPGRGAGERKAARVTPALRCGGQPAGTEPPVHRAEEIDELPFYSLVTAESVYFLTRKRAIRSPPRRRCATTATRRLASELGRFLAEEAEAGGATVSPETPAVKLLVADGRVRGVRTGDRGRGRDGEELRTSSRAPTSRPRDRPRRGHAGPPDRRGDRALRPQRREPAGLGARRQGGLAGREAARPRHPHDGLAAPPAKKYREFGGSFIYPMGDDMVTLGMVVGLDYRDAELSVHDLLQELKTHPHIRKSSTAASGSSGARRRSPRAASSRCRTGCTRPACCSAATAPAS